MDARFRTSTVKSVGGSRGDVFVAPGRCDVRPRCQSVTAFQRWTCVNDVVGVVDHFTRNYEGGGVWYVVGGPSLFTLSQYAGAYPECPGIPIEPRSYLGESLR